MRKTRPSRILDSAILRRVARRPVPRNNYPSHRPMGPKLLPSLEIPCSVARATNPYSYPEEISIESYRKFTVAATRAVGVGESQTGNVCEPLSSTPSCRQSNADTRHWQTPTTATATTTTTMASKDDILYDPAG
ncbi:hypothetical protein G5I_13888 [Acromyrmex echinatior]|uniref:Uncharacterized protein n=1 Tax=Acromyrmex echinatior TaxID=103372 RepID=F4X679_ACREC|nr:hypothetical protein G5I_13888 [Acromyrmex echinatior]